MLYFATNPFFSIPLYSGFYSCYGKRALNFTVELSSLVCLLPVFAILAFLPVVIQQTPLFFPQRRIGRGLKPFHIIKFKTLKNISNSEGHLLPNEQSTTLLDKLAKLVNVLLDGICFIDSRPSIPEKAAIFTPSTWRKRMFPRPDITGLAHIHHRNYI